MTLRWARSPVAPNRTTIEGSGTRSRRRPSRRTFSTGLARDARLPSLASRSSRIVRGASLGRGAGRAGIGWSSGAGSLTGPGSATGAAFREGFVRVVATGRPLLGLDFVPAELVAEGGQDLRSVRVVLTRAEPGQER